MADRLHRAIRIILRRPVAYVGHQLEYVVLVENLASRLQDCFNMLRVRVVVNQVLERSHRLLEIADVDDAEGVLGEIVRNIGAAVIDRIRKTQEGIAQFLGPVIRHHAIFENKMIFVGRDRVPLVPDRIEATAEEIDMFGYRMCLQPVQEFQALVVPGQGLILRADHRYSVHFNRHVHSLEGIVIEGKFGRKVMPVLMTDVHPHPPGQSVGMDDVWMRYISVAEHYLGKLTQEFVRNIDVAFAGLHRNVNDMIRIA